jgi:hypothetical protein
MNQSISQTEILPSLHEKMLLASEHQLVLVCICAVLVQCSLLGAINPVPQDSFLPVTSVAFYKFRLGCRASLINDTNVLEIKPNIRG